MACERADGKARYSRHCVGSGLRLFNELLCCSLVFLPTIPSFSSGFERNAVVEVLILARRAIQ